MKRRLNKGDLVYVAGPYTPPKTTTPHDSIRIAYQNVQNAKRMGVRILKLGYVPIVPYCLCHYLHQEMDEDLGDEWYKIDYKILDVCKAIVMLKNWRKSYGAVKERQGSLIQGKTVLTESDIKRMEKRKHK